MPTTWADAWVEEVLSRYFFQLFNLAQVMLLESIAMVENDAGSWVLNMNLRCE